MKVKVFAKLNLTLKVGAKQGEFHLIDSVATSVDICDTVEVVRRADMQVKVCGVQCVEQERNTAYKAAVAFRRAFAHKTVAGVDIVIHKGIPFGGGLGGSSADAAAVVYCMCKLFDVDIHSREIHELCASLGSDTKFMLFGGLGRLQGKGDNVSYYKMAEPLYFALTTFDVSMNSGEIYSAFDTLRSSRAGKNFIGCHCVEGSPVHEELSVSEPTEALLNLLQQGANGKAISLCFNDLQKATSRVSNYAKEYLSFIKSHGLMCNMTGSGSAYYVACVTKKEAEQVSELLNSHGFTTIICVSVPSGIAEI